MAMLRKLILAAGVALALRVARPGLRVKGGRGICEADASARVGPEDGARFYAPPIESTRCPRHRATTPSPNISKAQIRAHNRW